MKIEEEIREILELESSVLRINNEVRPKLIKKLTTLLKEEKKKAVEYFVEWLYVNPKFHSESLLTPLLEEFLEEDK